MPAPAANEAIEAMFATMSSLLTPCARSLVPAMMTTIWGFRSMTSSWNRVSICVVFWPLMPLSR